MSLHCAFLFPKGKFNLIFMSTIGYISDNMFYRLNFLTNQTEIQLNPNGRSYQAITTNYKRGLIVLVDYGRNPCFSFSFIHKKEQYFQLKGICTLEVHQIVLSFDAKYLLISCGVPEKQIIIVDVEKKRQLKGDKCRVPIFDRNIIQIQFNPANNKIFAVMFEKAIQIYQITEIYQVSETNDISQCIQISKKTVIRSETPFETFIWDELNNIYCSHGKNVFVFSTDTEKEVISYDLEGDFDGQVIANFLLTPKHLILIYCNGRIQWLNKFYPDLMEEEQIWRKPFYLDKCYQFSTPINYAMYDQMLSTILVAHKNGFFSVLHKQAERLDNQDEDEDNKGANKNKLQKNKKLSAEISQFGPYHANHIVFCREVKDKAILMTISKAGRIIFWSTIKKKPIAYSDASFEVYAADVNENFTILCVSTCYGIVQFYSISDFNNIFLFKEFKLLEKGDINQILFSSTSQQVACLSTQNKRVFYILAQEGGEIQMLGYVNIPYIPFSISWNTNNKTLIKPKYELLFCCIGFGIIMVNGPAPFSTQLRGKQLQLNCDLYAQRTDLQQKLLIVLATGEILSTGSDKILKKYRQAEEPINKFNPQAKISIPAPIEQLDSHDLETTFMKISPKVFISGGAEGALQIRFLDNFSQAKHIQVNGWKNANLFTGAISSTDDLFFVCGKDGCLSMWKTNQVLDIKESDQLKNEKSNLMEIKSAGQNLKYFEVALQDEYMQRMKQSITKKKKSQLDKITKIKTQLQLLLNENETHVQLQKLGRDEFVIDLQLRDRVTRTALENCEKIKKQSIRNVMFNQVLRNKLKELTWDIMQEHLRAINGLKNKYLVYNYQIRKIGSDEKRKLQLIMDLRKNQLKEVEKREGKQIVNVQFYKNKNVVNAGILQPLVLTVFEKKEDKKEDKTKKKKQEENNEKQMEEVQEIPKDEVWQLLYSSFQLFSDNAKKNQIILMQNVIIKIKQAFNRQFNKMLKYRQSQNQVINDKNKRIMEISEQLKKNQETIFGNKNILQNAEDILEVTVNDIPFARYLSREEKDKIEKEKQKQEERLRALAEDDSSQRALQKMMGGTLEQKKISILEVQVEREKWMDKAIEEMTEEEKMKYKQYEQKKQKAEEEKQRIVKKLEAQLRKLKLQIDDIMEKYDEKLFNLLRKRIEYDLRIEEQQLYCIRLSLSMVNNIEQEQRYQQLSNKQSVFKQKIQKLQSYRQHLHQKEEQLQKEKQSKRVSLDTKKLGDAQTKIKTVEKSVFEQYTNNIKKRREVQDKLIQSDEIIKYQIIPLDPMKEIQSKLLSNHIVQHFKYFLPEIKTLQPIYDLSDTQINTLESRFKIRKEEAELERKLKVAGEGLKKIEEAIQQRQNMKQDNEKQLDDIKNYLQKSKSDLQIEVRIKKGFVEIDSETPVPKLDDALFISKAEIDEKNASIIEKAGLKIEVMKQIKACKISVTQETLELERKQSEINETSKKIKQIQMLKVKKEMQTALAKKDTKINENELRSLKEQIEKVKKEGEKRINLFEKKIEKVSQEIDAIQKENKQLEVQKWNLEKTVKQREKIKDMMVGENGGPNQEAAEKFEQISINRKLFDKAKQQTDEIELLREELSKLKAKTFANFSSVQR